MLQKSVWRFIGLALLAAIFSSQGVYAQQQSLGTLRGQVSDEFGGLIVGANVTVADASGVERAATTDNEGRYAFTGLAPGRYTLRAQAPGFAAFENTEVEVSAGRTEPFNIALSVTIEQVEVTVAPEADLSTDPENNAGAVVLRGADLDTLPDDPDDLAEALQALAGPGSGQEGGQFFIDGFSNGRLPPKESIREIRINRNPFSAEYDRVGFGRIEIFTKPGTDKFRGQAFFNFSDESLNSRNPFAPTRAPFQARRFGGNLSGPIIARRASFFIDFQRNETDDNDVINAIILNPALLPEQFGQTVLTPARRTTFSPRIDYQLNKNNTLMARYTYQRATALNSGVGDFSLLSRAYNTESTEQTVQLTETAIINQSVINETRFQYARERSRQTGGNQQPTIRVLEAFTGGGAQVGLSFNNQDRFELSNYTSWTMGKHSLKAGARLRSVRLRDVSPQNFSGTFTFAGGLAPQLDADNRIVNDAGGNPVLIPITSIERYRRTLFFQQPQFGLTPAQVRALGGGPTQFSIAGGDPEADVSQVDFGPFFQDDWRVRPDLTLSMGLRYETQSNIHSNLNFAPRVAFAWSPRVAGQQGQQRTVIRGGFGIFYQRFAENLTLQSNRFNGENQQQFVITTQTAGGPAILDLFPSVPTVAQLSAFRIPQTRRVVADDLQAPYTMQAAISFEHQLPYRTTLSINFIAARTLHALRSRNINAPVPGTGLPPVRPFGDVGNIFQYESSGRFNQTQLVVSANNRLSNRFTVFATYTWNRARSDTDGVGTFPINQYDTSGEYGRAAQDIRHTFSIRSTISALPWGLRLSPVISANSGRPFNITTGRDTNGDTLFNERPAFATDLTKPGVVQTRFGAFDPNPVPGQSLIIPRNYGTGPSFFTVDLRLGKTFGFGDLPDDASGRAGGGGGGRGGRGGRGGGGGGRGGRGGGGFGGAEGGTFGEGSETPKRYNLTVSLSVQNLLNHTNAGIPIGNLSSPLFGQSNSTAGRFGFGGGGNQSAGNRRVELLLRFSF
ncbi:MAG TPA: carboxypeptidase regulatory-like domain-containing protein [Pyrinomonadaceae bacterium]